MERSGEAVRRGGGRGERERRHENAGPAESNGERGGEVMGVCEADAA